MPILKNAQKALRSSQRKAVVNQRNRSQVKTTTDAFKKNPTAELLAAAFSALDRAAKNHLSHKNKVARVKSQLSKKLK